MPIEQEPIKIVIPDEDEEVVMQPESSRPGLSDTLTSTGREVAGRARNAWESEQRRQASAVAEAGLRKGAEMGQSGLVKGLNWLSDKLAELAQKINEKATS